MTLTVHHAPHNSLAALLLLLLVHLAMGWGAPQSPKADDPRLRWLRIGVTARGDVDDVGRSSGSPSSTKPGEAEAAPLLAVSPDLPGTTL